MTLDPTVSASLAIGVLGVATGLVTVLYARNQVKAAHRQADEAARIADVEGSRRTLEDFHAVRRRRFTNPALLAEAKVASPEIVELLDADGGAEAFLVNCETLDTFQEIYFLRKRGILRDEHWYLWSQMHMLGPAKLPAFQRYWRVASQNEWLHPEFLAFYAPAFAGASLGDPLPS